MWTCVLSYHTALDAECEHGAEVALAEIFDRESIAWVACEGRV